MEDSANAIVVIGKASSAAVPPVFAACVVLATTRLDVNRAVRKRLGDEEGVVRPARRHRRADRHDDGRRHPVRPPGRPAAVDRRPRDGAGSAIVVGGGSRAAKVVGPPSMLLTIPGAEVVDDLATE